MITSHNLVILSPLLEEVAVNIGSMCHNIGYCQYCQHWISNIHPCVTRARGTIWASSDYDVTHSSSPRAAKTFCQYLRNVLYQAGFFHGSIIFFIIFQWKLLRFNSRFDLSHFAIKSFLLPVQNFAFKCQEQSVGQLK